MLNNLEIWNPKFITDSLVGPGMGTTTDVQQRATASLFVMNAGQFVLNSIVGLRTRLVLREQVHICHVLFGV